MTPYKAMFGVEAFDFGVDFNLTVRREAEPTREELAEHIEDLHRELYDRSWKAKQDSKKAYVRAVKETKVSAGGYGGILLPPRRSRRWTQDEDPVVGALCGEEATVGC
uniref:Uncharacterized protein n=1 Tax=Rhodosorus marinus TaxID=101924 RepID=A0A7S0G4Y3_9RHOD|mmetsp:Transcript_24171/g.34831  ORF Transcript_24171/g.34831 Transcript_24171/m.34831 type:complete len:108 (+) Transcript_24171:87-410(+)